MLKILALVYWLGCLVKSSGGLVQNIKIGAIFHEGDAELEQVFDQALRDLDDETSLFNLIAVKRTSVPLESFQTAQTVCELLEEGIAAIFGPRRAETRNVVSSIAGRFGVPHLEYSFRHKDDESSRMSVNLYPSSRSYERLIAEAIKRMNWRSYTHVYQTKDGLARIQEAMENKDRENHPITVRELQPLASIDGLPTGLERDNVYESFVKDILVSAQYSIVLDVENANLAKVLDTMAKLNLVSDYFACLIVNLDSTSLDIGQFVSKDSVADITQFSFVKQPNDWHMSVEAALLYDAVFVFGDALANLFKDVSSLDSEFSIEPKPLSCNGDAKYDAGPNITAAILRKTKTGRKTGAMKFNERGERDFELELVKNQVGKTVKIGEWKDDRLRIVANEREMNASLAEAAKNKIFKVTTRVGQPYVMLVEDERPGRLIGGKKYEGYCIDLIGKIEKLLGITCEFELVPDGNYGNKNPVTGQWNGLIKQLLEFKADFAICDLTITSERQSAVDFTAPFMNLGISILFKKADKIDPDLFSFMSPLSAEVWMYMATAYLVISTMLFFQARIAPDEWINPHPCNPEPDELENSFNLMNAMWLTMGSLMQQGCDILPRAGSIRMIAGMWWFFVLIMVSSYTANLAAFLTAVKMEETINDVEDLAKQTKVSYGSVASGATYSFFKNSNMSLYKRLFNTMNDAKPSVFTKSNDEGLERVLRGKRKYAFFMESTNIEYQIERHCELQQVGTLLDNKGYGIAMPPNSPYRTHISTAILNLQEKGELQQLKQKWWKEMGGGKCDGVDDSENSNELGMANVGGVFLILIFGCVLSTFIAIVEFLWNIRKVAIEEKVTPWEALVAELKFVIDFKAKTKPVRVTKNNSKATSLQGNGNSAQLSTGSSLHRFNSKDSTSIVNLTDNL